MLHFDHHKLFSEPHTSYEVNDVQKDPYESLQLLGQGSFGSVDQVIKKDDKTRTRLARKRFFLPYRNRDQKIEEIKNEAQIIRRLHHKHIVKVITTYQWTSQFGIIMSPVADTNLQQYLDRLDTLSTHKEREFLLSHLMIWPICLLRALDYLHEMRVKHRDIKPSNILILGNTIYLADFGIARSIANDATTGSNGTAGAFTPTYSAPEFFIEGAPRGRAVDVYSLGCVFFEIGLSLNDTPGRYTRFREHLGAESAPRSFAANTQALLRWICNVWASESEASRPLGLPLNTPASFTMDLAFLMMDPDPSKRITSRQLIAVLTHMLYKRGLVLRGCSACRPRSIAVDRNIPLHSKFLALSARNLPDAEHALQENVAGDWEDAKTKWLKHHMWWD